MDLFKLIDDTYDNIDMALSEADTRVTDRGKDSLIVSIGTVGFGINYFSIDVRMMYNNDMYTCRRFYSKDDEVFEDIFNIMVEKLIYGLINS